MTKKKNTRPDTLSLDRSARLSFRCPVILRNAVEALAEKDHRSVSDWLVIAVNKAVNEAEH